IHRQKLKYPETDVVVIDPLQEYAGLCEVFDGERVVIGGDTAINPFHIEPTPPEKLAEVGRNTPYKDAIRRDMDFVESYYALEGLEDFSDKRGTWERAIKIAHKRKGIRMDPTTHDNESPTLPDVREVFVDMAQSATDFVDDDLEDVEKAVADREDTAITILNNDLEPFRENGKYEHLTRQTDLDIGETGFLYLDLQQYENEQDSGGLMMELLVSQVYEQAKVHDHPSMLAIDESHYMLRRSSSMEALKQASRHGRHYELSLGFGTHSLKEFFDESGDGDETQLTDNAEIIINNMAFMLFLYNDEMNEDWAGELGLTEREMKYVQNAMPGNEERGYSQALLKVDEKGCYPLHIEMSEDLNPREFALLRYDQSNHPNDLAEYLEAFDDSCAWSWTEDDYGTQRTRTAENVGGDSADDGASVSSPGESGGAESERESRETDVDVEGSDQPLTAIEGVGEARSAALHRAGFDCVGDVLDGETGDLTSARGVGEQRAEHLKQAAEAFVQDGHSVLDPGQSVADISVVDATKANALREAGYETVREVVNADPDELAVAEGFDPTHARFIQEKAEQIDQTVAADGDRQ
ncbi:MAG TPA: helix-hairpin-helix domain-containing protein, partial [Halococcus sp.]|nr:helix-hairpin-helix domain-containing protein [Halococcus sp.]